MNKFEYWYNRKELDQDIFSELEKMKGNISKIEDAFYKDLSFGTGGLRGVIGAGTNRMNIYTVAKATRGLSKYFIEKFEEPTCAIAYDSRIKSDVFAKIAATTLADKGVKVYIYDCLMPTPMLSFAVRELECSGGIVITASHNPAKYNGYKVYGEDGCQITLEAAEEIASYIGMEDDFEELTADFSDYIDNGMVSFIESDIIEKYYKQVLKLNLQKPKVDLNVVYSPLNGSGNKPVREILSRLGNIDITVVGEQEHPDGNFTTCSYPNPEIDEAMSLAAKLAIEKNADIFLATDPDCDRVGVGVITPEGYKLISGNEMGVMLLDYICKQRIKNGTMPMSPVAVKSIVTTEMANAVAKKYNLNLINVLTGFKFIGEQIAKLEQSGEAQRFIFGFEESYGYLSGDFVRDKDAVIASMLICEMTAYYKSQGKTLLAVLEGVYEEYGFYKQDLLTYEFEGASGMEKMNTIINSIRSDKSNKFLAKSITDMVDYENDDTGLPKSNVLKLSLEDGSTVIVRPSGTEPKLKLYVTTVADNMAEADQLLKEMCISCNEFIGRN